MRERAERFLLSGWRTGRELSKHSIFFTMVGKGRAHAHTCTRPEDTVQRPVFSKIIVLIELNTDLTSAPCARCGTTQPGACPDGAGGDSDSAGSTPAPGPQLVPGQWTLWVFLPHILQVQPTATPSQSRHPNTPSQLTAEGSGTKLHHSVLSWGPRTHSSGIFLFSC